MASHNTPSDFWNKVDRSGKCWIWQGIKNNQGYGRWWAKKSYLAHRYAFEITYGQIPKDHSVCHMCDIPLCVHPDHLFIGTHQDNMRDRERKGRTPKYSGVVSPRLPRGDNHFTRRHPELLLRGDESSARKHPERLARGTRNWKTSLTDDQVIEIRNLPETTSFAEIGRRYSISPHTAANIVKGISWKHLIPGTKEWWYNYDGPI